MSELERARAFFAKDAYATLLGAEIDAVQDGCASCSLTLRPEHLNAEGDVMGGVLFTLADFAFAVAANLNQPPTVTLSCQVSFLSPPKGKRILAQATRVRSGWHTCFYSVEVRDDTDAIVAVASVSGFIKRPEGP